MAAFYDATGEMTDVQPVLVDSSAASGDYQQLTAVIRAASR